MSSIFEAMKMYSKTYIGVARIPANIEDSALREEKCPNTELFLVRILLYSDWIWKFTRKSPYLVRMQENTDRQ